MPSKSIPRISEAEWEVMRVVWAHSPLTAGQIIEHLSSSGRTWHPKTTKTLLARLVKKGVLDYEPQGRAYVYEPLATEKDCVAAASASFLERVFGGALKPMIAHFVEHENLTDADWRELETLLSKRRRKR